METRPEQKTQSFDRLMRGLTAVPKAELDAEIAKDQREKAKASTPSDKPKRKK